MPRRLLLSQLVSKAKTPSRKGKPVELTASWDDNSGGVVGFILERRLSEEPTK
jgi:hypothetical protein